MNNCRLAPIDARIGSLMRSLVGTGESTHTPTRMALHHPCPGEGSGGSS